MTGQPYSYAENDPLNGTDPLGLCSINPFSNQSCVSSAAQAVGGVVSTAVHFVVKHRGALADIGAGVVCIGTVGSGCLAAVAIAAGVNAQQAVANSEGPGGVALAVLKSAALSIPGLAELQELRSGAEALAMFERLGISTDGFEAPALFTYLTRLFQEGAFASPAMLEIYRGLFGCNPG